MPIGSVLWAFWQGLLVDYLKNCDKTDKVKFNVRKLNIYLLFMLLNDNSLKVAVEEVTLTMRVYWPIVCEAMIVERGDSEVYFRETPFFVDQFLKVTIIEDAMKWQPLIWWRHTVCIQHDDVLDETENLVTAFISLHNWHQVLHLVNHCLTHPDSHLLSIVLGLPRYYLLICDVTKKASRLRSFHPWWLLPLLRDFDVGRLLIWYPITSLKKILWWLF